MEIYYILLGIFVLAIIIVLIVFSISSYQKHIEAYKVEFVKTNSTKLAQVKKINNDFLRYHISTRRIIVSNKLDSKKAFDNFDDEVAIRDAFFNRRTEIYNAIEKVTQEMALAKEYYQKIRNVPSTDFDSLPKDKHVTKDFFCSLEDSLASKAIKKIEAGLVVSVSWSYTSPAGRRSYSDRRVFNYDKTVEMYQKMFNQPQKKVETATKIDDYLKQVEKSRQFKSTSEKETKEASIASKPRIDESAKAVSKQLTKSIYKIDDVVEMYRDFGIEATKLIAEATLSNAGYKKSKYPGFYIQSSIKNVSDLILSSSNELGLIIYENQIKDEEYDNAIVKLEKEGRIVPIDNLHFLKISKNLNYCGMTIDEIDEFESLLLKFARKQLFVSFKQIKENIDCLVTRIEFDECFLQTIVKYCGFLTPVPGIDKLYTTIQKPQRIMFLEWLLKGKKSVDAFDLIYDLKELYDIEYNIYSITYDLDKNKTKLYYNEEMEKIYSNKEYFFEELEDVL